jgi:hypothetical protein
VETPFEEGYLRLVAAVMTRSPQKDHLFEAGCACWIPGGAPVVAVI